MIECRSCKKPQSRFRAGKVGSQPIFKDVHGRRWNGFTCPTCHYENMRLARKDKSEVVEEELGPKKPLFKETKYDCVRCGVKTFNRYRCASCLSVMRHANDSGLHQADVLYG